MNQRSFTWQDGERTIRFGRGTAAEAVGVLGGPGYALLTTERARAGAPAVVEAAATVHRGAARAVDELAGELLGTIAEDRIVALGGGRVVDVAKALAGASGGKARAMAIPTTLSGAEMTRVHRQAAGAPEGSKNVRPAVVVNDPGLSASQPEPELAASALNALGHAAEGPCTPRANPVSTLAALEAARLIVGAWPRSGGPDRDGSRSPRCSPATRSTRPSTACTTCSRRRSCGSAGSATGPPTRSCCRTRSARSAGASRPGSSGSARRWAATPRRSPRQLCARTGATRLSELGVDGATLDACADAAAERQELDLTPPRADRAELRALYGDAL